ncbi:hypothetical protein PRUPE_6G117200 [Prunus persica]|uniref:Pentacotripeptide-repeat region of PRORP domain-containing protein n=1 Tax=Prunus persica TaxID=3760 RepID=A0A251NNY0_PRUPE|nr:hypothetical protein PRUPE_6G117200 [Prunus persica]
MIMRMWRPASTYPNLRRHRGGMPFLESSVLFNNYWGALFHSQCSERRKYKNTYKARQFESNSNSPEITDLEDALNLFNSMLQTRPLPSIGDFNKLLGQVAKLKHYSAAISLCKQMDLLPILPNVSTLNVINCFCHLGQMGGSLSVLAKLFKFGFQPDAATYNTLIKGFVMEDRISEGRINEAENLLTLMKERGCSPNGCTYNTIIRGCINNKETSRAIRLVQEMADMGFAADNSTMKWVVDLLSKDKLDPELVKRIWYFKLFYTVLKRKNHSI